MGHRHLRPVRTQSRQPVAISRHSWSSFEPKQLAEIKIQQGCTISVCLPARNEELTVGPIVDSIRRHLQSDVALIDEIIVLDDGSRDRTAALAAAAGARVVEVDTVLSAFGPSLGKGDVLWRSLAVASGDIVLWCDTDIVEFETQFVHGLLGPLLTNPDIQLSKGCFNRSGDDDVTGGRVTELVAKPLLRLLRPELAGLDQPLSGSYGGWRSLLEQIPFEPDFGVEIGVLIDTADLVGVGAIAQVDLGTFRHSHRTLAQLAPQATSVARAVLRRCPGIVVDDFVNVLHLDNGQAIDPGASRRPPMAEVRSGQRLISEQARTGTDQ